MDVNTRVVSEGDVLKLRSASFAFQGKVTWRTRIEIAWAVLRGDGFTLSAVDTRLSFHWLEFRVPSFIQWDIATYAEHER